jgi:MFS family permease
MPASEQTKALAWRFVILLSLVSLLSDTVYEGARSISGPFMADLGASAIVIGTVSGLGEMLGYGLRMLSGWLSDRSKRYWTITVVGYFVNLLSVPALALANNWEAAAALLICERAGKAVRTPARDVMLAAAGEKVGTGLAFGLHGALDQVGAVIGPLIVACIIYIKLGVRFSFAILLIPAIAALTLLLTARFLYPRPQDLAATAATVQASGLTRSFWLYLLATSLMAAGYVDFPLIAYHLSKAAITTQSWIPIFYSLAMATDALGSFLFGKLFDRFGVSLMLPVFFASIFLAPLLFLTRSTIICLTGMALWGICLGAQASIMRAAIASMVPSARRGSAYGLFGLTFGVAWFLGSVILGYLYDRSLHLLVVFSLACEILALLAFLVFLPSQKAMKA